jgi:uncharacterized protein (DUF305 family)
MSPQPELDASRANGASHQPPWNTPLSLPDPLLIRKTLISLAIMSVVSGLTLATAQDQNKASHLRAASTTRNDQEFIIDSALAISTMSLNMAVDSTGDVDRDFVAMMMPHHQGAIDLARAEVKYGHNEKLRQLALSMIVEREHEMSVMRNPFGEPATSDTSEHSSDGRSREE